MSTDNTLFRPDLLAKYSANGPRYTSYPTALQFRDDFDPAELAAGKHVKPASLRSVA